MKVNNVVETVVRILIIICPSFVACPQNGDVDECHGELRQLCVAVLNARAGLRQRAASLLPSGPAGGIMPIAQPPMPGKRKRFDLSASACIRCAKVRGHLAAALPFNSASCVASTALQRDD